MAIVRALSVIAVALLTRMTIAADDVKKQQFRPECVGRNVRAAQMSNTLLEQCAERAIGRNFSHYASASSCFRRSAS